MSDRPAKRLPGAVCAFGVIACLFATFYFLGDIGNFNDDYFYNQRDIQTGEIRALMLDRPVHVWRPLFQVVMPTLHTLLWNHNWALHLISTLLHACVCWLLMRLMVTLGLSLRTAVASSMLFMLYPAHFEAVYWSCCVPTLIATCMVLGMFHWQAWWLRKSEDPRSWQRLLPIAFAACAFGAASLNEQPTGLLAALPLLGVLIKRPPENSVRTHVQRSIVPPAMAGIALMLYIWQHFQHMDPPERKPSDPSALEDLISRIQRLAGTIPGELGLRDFGTGALQHGVETLKAHPGTTAVFCVLSLAAAVVMARWWTHADTDRPSPVAGAQSATGTGELPGLYVRLVVLGGAMFVCGWTPIMLAHDVSMPRLHYPTNLGLALALAAIIQMIANPVPRNSGDRVLLRGLGLGMLLLALAPMVAMHVGIQDAYRKRYQRDMKEMSDLAALTKGHPGQMLFMPMRVESRVVSTGSSRFDAYFAGCWHWDYAAGWLLQQVFGRSDVHIALVAVAENLSLYARPRDRTTTAILVGRFARPLPDPKPVLNPGGRGRIVPWERIVPFTVSADGVVRLCSPIEIVDVSGATVETFVPPIVGSLEHSWRTTAQPFRVPLAPGSLTDGEHEPMPTRRERRRQANEAAERAERKRRSGDQP